MAGAGDPSARPTALGTDDALGLVRPTVGIRVDVLLEKPDREVPAELDGPLFALVEGHELVLVLGIEHQIGGGRGVVEPSLAKSRWGIVGLR